MLPEKKKEKKSLIRGKSDNLYATEWNQILIEPQPGYVYTS